MASRSDIIQLKEFKVLHWVGDKWNTHFIYCPISNISANRALRQTITIGSIAASHEGATFPLQNALLRSGHIGTCITAPFHRRGAVKIFAGTFSYKIIALAPSVLKITSNDVGVGGSRCITIPIKENGQSWNRRTRPQRLIDLDRNAAIIRSEVTPSVPQPIHDQPLLRHKDRTMCLLTIR